MACEVPVISSNAGGIPEINIDGVTGYMCAVGDVESMARKTIALLKDEALLETFSRNALEQARNFHIDIVLPKYEAYYQKIYDKVMK